MYKHLSFQNPNKFVSVPQDNAWQYKCPHGSACSQPEPPPQHQECVDYCAMGVRAKHSLPK